jgi:hypothetical protein
MRHSVVLFCSCSALPRHTGAPQNCSNRLRLQPYKTDKYKRSTEQYRTAADKIIDRFFAMSYLYVLQSCCVICGERCCTVKGEAASYRPPSDSQLLGTRQTRTGRYNTNRRRFDHNVKQVGYKLELSEECIEIRCVVGW